MFAATSDTIGLAVVIVVALFSALTAPLLLARRMDREHHRDRLEDFARQDHTAELLKKNTELVTQSSSEIRSSLAVIRADVNSNLTTQIQATRDALAGQRATMVRLITDPSPEEARVIAHLADGVAELDALLKDRRKQ